MLGRLLFEEKKCTPRQNLGYAYGHEFCKHRWLAYVLSKFGAARPNLPPL